MIKRKVNSALKLAVLGIITFIALIFLIIYPLARLKNSDYFKIKHTATNKPQVHFDFSYFLGRNIFNIDLNKESSYIREAYPVYKSIRLFRILPDRLFISFTERAPIAYVKLYRYFYVDKDLVFFDLAEGQETMDRPVITGLERKIAGPKPGRRYNIKELITALNIIKEIETNSQLKKYKIYRIDISNPGNISCLIRLSDYSKYTAAKGSGILEVKTGQDNIGDKIRILAGLFIQLGEDINNIEYIDLRFKEAVVKFKNAT